MAAAGKSRALLHGRLNAGFEDIQAIAVSVLQHRIVLDYHAKLDGESGTSIASRLLSEIPPLDRPIPSTLAVSVPSPRGA
jgi:MoxR-like ATPase